MMDNAQFYSLAVFLPSVNKRGVAHSWKMPWSTERGGQKTLSVSFTCVCRDFSFFFFCGCGTVSVKMLDSSFISV